MASGSMREAIKLVTSTFAAPTVAIPLPDELHETIDGFLKRYHDIDDHDSQRFHEDLLSLYMRHVAGNPGKNAPFLHTLRLVRPALKGGSRWSEWWDLVLKPTIDSVGHKRKEVEEAKELLLSILLFEADEDRDGELARLSAAFLKKTLDLYLTRTKIPSSAEDVVSQEDDYVSREVESVLVAYGRRKPKELLLAVDELFVQKQHRTQALILLNAFVRLQTPHLHLVLETPLIQHLEKCLLVDASSTVIGQALLVLIMFLPHITSALTSSHHLPKLFLIYSRILCWDKLNNDEDSIAGQTEDEDIEYSMEEEKDDSDPTWEVLQQSTDYPDTSPPTLLHYFTFLYGLFPLNFMSFVRKPRKFLKSLSFPGADDFDLDQDLIHRRTEPYRRVHLLHPNMFNTTVEDELTENRWLNSDPADVVMDCMDLCVAVSTTLEDPGPPPATKLPDLPVPPIPDAPADLSLDDGTTANDSGGSWRNTQSTMFASSTHEPDVPETFEIPPKTAKSVEGDKAPSPLLKCRDVMNSPTLPPAKETPKKRNFLGAPITAPQRLFIHAPNMDNFSHIVTTTGSPTHTEFQNLSMASLQREIMLLRNDLSFERYLKSQHLAHIGQLQRKHIKEATAEADTQNLINTNKTLKSRLAKMNDQYAQLKKETLTSRSQSKKWEGELSGKVRSYREDQKAWQSEEDSLRFELKKTQLDCEELKKIVEKAEAEQLRAQQRTQALEFELADYAKMKRDLEAAQDKIMAYEDQGKDLNAMIQQRNDLRNELELVNMQLNSRELERERAFKAYERRIMELEARLRAAEKMTGKPGQLPPSVQQMLDSALAANNAKIANIKKMYHRLQDQKTELEMQYHELEGKHQATVGRLREYERTDHRDPEKDTLSRNFSVRYSGGYDSNFLPPLSSDVPTTEAYDYYPEYQSPISPTNNTIGPRPVRTESLPTQNTQRPQHEPFTVGFGQDFSAAYDASLNAHFSSQKSRDGTHSNDRAYSVSSGSSSKGEKKEKVTPKSEVRMYGRGGAQNIGTKKKEKEPKKTGGFRGLKGIM
ncbi:hypothetical protein K458DRAFT_391182 [Lentithecium fluviatile CBS 122367]|uniref:Hamartin n=1 Tax=Lentithecium fluviatile CBS 122367 TaxID=1168545 RepID=A0A6G1IV81_9PLEO|nr:hypothetical protein K458DRAFT_391182 [Lentithecium fluviatile CBS 122367]